MINVPWIVKNMIGESGETTKLRRPSEIEIKVQKSLQKLTIPDWYVNKRRESPKIISDRRPIEIRPAPWKEFNYKNRPPFSKNHRCNEATEKTAIAHPVFGNDEGSAKSLTNEPKFLKKSQKFFKRGFEMSKTFPKMSPSRKIQNINIVFPTTNSPVYKFSEKLVTLDSADEGNMIKNSANDTTKPKTENKNDIINDKDYSNEFLTEEISTFKNDTILNKNLHNSLVKPTARILTYEESPKRYGRNNYSYRNDDDLEIEERKNSENVDDIYRMNIIDSKIDYFESRKFISGEKTPKKEFTKNVSPKLSKNAVLTKNFCHNFIEENSVVSNEEEEEEKIKYDNVELFKTPKKSTEMENIIKKSNNQRKRSSGKSFVEEIIEELNAKCSPKVKKDHVRSPGSKNFVKKLVRELEMGLSFTENENINNNNSKNRSVLFNDENLSTNREENDSSITGETEFLRKYNDNEFCEMAEKTFSLRSSVCSSTFGSFSRALEGRSGKESREAVTAYVDDDDESVFWIPLPTCRLPRTSSLKNVTTSSTTNLPTEISEPSTKTGWGRTFNKGQRRSRALFRIDETTVGDSGYSDRSETNSSSSSVVGEESWYSESETTRTASEDSDNGFDNCADNNFRKAHFYRSKQRTSVV